MKRFFRRRRGAIMVAATWILLILVAATIITANRVRIETLGSANHISRAQADMIELGGEQYVLQQIAFYNGDAGSIVNADPNEMQQVQIGDGYFWILRVNPDDPNNYDFGITDESSKININQATSAMLQYLPNMTQDIADSIVSWRSANASAVTSSGTAGSEIYYMTLPDPYHSKGAPFESIEELLMIKDVTRDLLFGQDTNRNGVLEAAEQANANPAAPGITLDLNQDDGRGWYNLLTAFTSVPASINPPASSTGTATQIININQNITALNTVLSSKLGSARANNIMQRVGPQGGGGGGRGGGGGATTPQTFTSVFDFYTRSGMTSAEFAQVVDQITTGRVATAVVNVNTAPISVLQCLPGLTQVDATTMVSQRDGYQSPSVAQTGVPVGSFGWMLNAISGPKANAIGAYITARSFQYSADVVGVSGDGRAFKRVRIVVDNSPTVATTPGPAKIIYRKDLTDLGWPLDPAIRDQLRSGQGLTTGPLGMKGGM